MRSSFPLYLYAPQMKIESDTVQLLYLFVMMLDLVKYNSIIVFFLYKAHPDFQKLEKAPDVQPRLDDIYKSHHTIMDRFYCNSKFTITQVRWTIFFHLEEHVISYLKNNLLLKSTKRCLDYPI